MIKKVLSRAAAGTAAASLVLVPGAVVAGPQFSTVACDYPGGYATSTALRLTHTVAPYGTRNRADVSVTSGTGTPLGSVVLRVADRGPWGMTLDNGEASQRIPRHLPASETYKVRARYKGKCDHNPSSDTAYYTVVKAKTTVNAGVVNKQRAMFNATFNGSGGVDPRAGAARFTVIKKRANGNKVVRKGRVDVAKGYAEIDMKDLGSGRYRLKAVFIGRTNTNYTGGADTKNFRVKR